MTRTTITGFAAALFVGLATVSALTLPATAEAARFCLSPQEARAYVADRGTDQLVSRDVDVGGRLIEVWTSGAALSVISVPPVGEACILILDAPLPAIS